jgi:16S rRNA (cytidine1402-2'-O)-methyltransferase
VFVVADLGRFDLKVGQPTDRFTFEGFMPAKEQPRRRYLETLQTETRTLVFYEAPHRLREVLASLVAAFGADRPVTLARELTKLHEEFWRGTLGSAAAHYGVQEPKGEFTIVVAGAVAREVVLSDGDLVAELGRLVSGGMSRSEASRALATQTGLPKRHLYQLALGLPD